MDTPETEILSRADYARCRVNKLIKDLRTSDMWSLKAEYLLSEAALKIDDALEELRLQDGLQRTYSD